ncbi:YcaO-like family protein [Halobaculum sp. MBLA0147]|uniref:YcaO-like family protein n=1 Tax=Halobaculum sp. MBLA0147 TaxID=3079934 RepID=UPI0035248975
MDVAIVGPDPAAEAVQAALGDVDANAMPVDVDLLGEFAVGVVVGTTGDDRFDRASATLETWIAVEVGGIGGQALSSVDAAVSTFADDTGCYDCLRHRAAAGGTTDEASPQGVASAVRFAGALAGRRLVRQFSGESLGGTVVEVPGHEREFLPVPGCDCHDAPTGLDRGTRDVPLDEVVAQMERAVDDRFGPVAEVGEQSSFPVPYYVAATADTTGFSDARCGEFGAGVAVDWNAAYAKAVGEALERYCAGVYRTGDLRRAPTEGVIDAVPVDRFVRPTDAPTPADDDRLLWADGVALATGEHAALPASLVYFPQPGRAWVPSITTGLGLGTSTDEALAAGLFEVVERDATMLSWYSTFEPMELTVESERFAALCKRARAEGLTVTPLLCTQNVDVPVVATAVHRDGEWPQFATGSAADFDAAAAAADATAEALQNWTELDSMGPAAAAEQEAAIGRYAEFPSSARSFVDAPATVAASDVTESVSADAVVDTLVERLDDAGLDAYAVRTTTADVATLGFEAVRVLVPEAQPLFTAEPFFGERAETVPASMGFEPRLDRAFHPFP